MRVEAPGKSKPAPQTTVTDSMPCVSCSCRNNRSTRVKPPTRRSGSCPPGQTISAAVERLLPPVAPDPSRQSKATRASSIGRSRTAYALRSCGAHAETRHCLPRWNNNADPPPRLASRVTAQLAGIRRQEKTNARARDCLPSRPGRGPPPPTAVQAVLQVREFASPRPPPGYRGHQ